MSDANCAGRLLGVDPRAAGLACGAACRARPIRRVRESPPAALRGSNVLLVTIDTLRADHVGAYGSSRGVTPTIDGFAKAMRFERTVRPRAADAALPRLAPDGEYPTRNGVHDNGTFRLGARPTTSPRR